MSRVKRTVNKKTARDGRSCMMETNSVGISAGGRAWGSTGRIVVGGTAVGLVSTGLSVTGGEAKAGLSSWPHIRHCLASAATTLSQLGQRCTGSWFSGVVANSSIH
jgi:hypothetical protein